MKRVKDPVYGYIEIKEEFMSGIVDTAPFQRLRRISQTSYSPLYASAVHNRFVHSLGVYYLGGLSVTAISETCKDFFEQSEEGDAILQTIFETFLLACLLHDVGHAPFSHTGEMRYISGKSNYDVIHMELSKAVNSEDFDRDIPGSEKYAAPHEIMSAIVGIQEYSEFIKDKELFARCITGYQYSKSTRENDVKNCFIQLLNSKVIDVDKLDYLTRDAYITGYDTVKIDYNRLLSALTIVKIEGKLSLAYKKSAVSVIENVVYAHDAERKWIQNHPIILYESYLLNHAFQIIENEVVNDNYSVFSREALSVKGVDFEKSIGKIRLLSDDDVVFLMKRFYKEGTCIEEFFQRDNRKHPIWKSETEYRAFFLSKITEGEVLDVFDNALKSTANYLQKNTDNWAINQDLAEKLKTEISNIEKLQGKEGITENDILTQKRDKTRIFKVVSCLLDFAKEKGYQGEFVLLRAAQFNSGFNKPDFSKIPLVFVSSGENKVVYFEKVAASFSGKESAREDFFYIYYDKHAHDSGEIKMETKEICGKLLSIFVDE